MENRSTEHVFEDSAGALVRWPIWIIPTNNKPSLRASSSLLHGRMGTTMELLSLLATHRILKNDSDGNNNGDDGDSGRPFFPYEYPIAAVSVAFFRLTLVGHDREPAELRWCFAALLALLAYHGKSYELILAVELFSYVIVYWWLYVVRSSSSTSSCRPAAYSAWQRLAMIAGGALLCRVVAHAVTTGRWLRAMSAVTPSGVVYVIKYLFPVDELREAIDIMFKLTLEPDILAAMLHHLFFVTAHIQIGIGYLGIHFLTQQQARRNLLVRLDVDDDAAPVTATNNNNDTPNTTSNGGKKPSTMIERAGSFKKGAAAFSTCPCIRSCPLANGFVLSVTHNTPLFGLTLVASLFINVSFWRRHALHDPGDYFGQRQQVRFYVSQGRFAPEHTGATSLCAQESFGCLVHQLDDGTRRYVATG
jgi:hypothetical protein